MDPKTKKTLFWVFGTILVLVILGVIFAAIAGAFAPSSSPPPSPPPPPARAANALKNETPEQTRARLQAQGPTDLYTQYIYPRTHWFLREAYKRAGKRRAINLPDDLQSLIAEFEQVYKDLPANAPDKQELREQFDIFVGYGIPSLYWRIKARNMSEMIAANGERLKNEPEKLQALYAQMTDYAQNAAYARDYYHYGYTIEEYLQTLELDMDGMLNFDLVMAIRERQSTVPTTYYYSDEYIKQIEALRQAIPRVQDNIARRTETKTATSK